MQKFFDCITFFRENFITNIRMEIIGNEVDFFVICESKYDHKGKKKNLEEVINLIINNSEFSLIENTSNWIETKSFINDSREYRKKIGGGMRQVGIIASAAKFALINRENLLDDHEKARKIYDELTINKDKINGLDSVVYKGTNMVLLEFVSLENSDKFLARLLESKIRAGYLREKVVRFVLHKDIDSKNIKKIINVIQSFS